MMQFKHPSREHAGLNGKFRMAKLFGDQQLKRLVFGKQDYADTDNTRRRRKNDDDMDVFEMMEELKY